MINFASPNVFDYQKGYYNNHTRCVLQVGIKKDTTKPSLSTGFHCIKMVLIMWWD